MSPPCLDNMASTSAFHIIPSLIVMSARCTFQPCKRPDFFTKVFLWPVRDPYRTEHLTVFNVFFVTVPLGSLGKYYPIFADGTH